MSIRQTGNHGIVHPSASLLLAALRSWQIGHEPSRAPLNVLCSDPNPIPQSGQRWSRLLILCLLAAAFFALLPARAAHAQQIPNWTINCGGIAQRPCSPNTDGLYSIDYNDPNFDLSEFPPYWFTNVHCDLALVYYPLLDQCGDPSPTGGNQGRSGGNRSLIGTSLNTPWIDFAMKQQRYGIQSDQAINWASIFGTHNSFSNYQDGAFDASLPGITSFNFNVDQKWSITDQLDAGARYIRIDPISYNVRHSEVGDTSGHDDFELRVCHESATNSLALDAECDFTSYGRLFAYAVDEVRTWLEQNPGEVLVLRMDRTQDSDLKAIDEALENNMEDKGVQILTVPGSGYGDSWDPSQIGWPSLREMRAMGKRIIILSSQGTPRYSFPWSWVVNDGYTDAHDGLVNLRYTECENIDGLDVRTRAFNEWSYIGEDRSGSNGLGAVTWAQGGAGLLDSGAVATATNCGFGIVNVDFLLAGKYAGSLSLGVDISFPGTDGFHLKPFDYTFSEPDTRREASIWSWDEGDFGQDGPAYMKYNGRWSSLAEETQLPFACAFQPGFVQNPVDYIWKVTNASGRWSDGPAACKAIGGTFWAPQSPVENARLLAASAGAKVWINYTAVNNNIVLEPDSANLQAGGSALLGSATPFVINVTQGQDASPLSPVFQYTGGMGGALSTSVEDATTSLFNPNVTIGSREKAIKLIAAPGTHDALGHITLAPGTYTQDFILTEQQNGAPVSQVFSMTVKVAPAPTVKITVGSSIPGQTLLVDGNRVAAPQTFSWVPGTQHKLDASLLPELSGTMWKFQKWSDGVASLERSYTTPQSDSSIQALFTEFFHINLQSSALGTLTLSPSASSGFYPAGSTVTISATSNPGYRFVEFTGSLNSTQNPQAITLGAPASIGAIFFPQF